MTVGRSPNPRFSAFLLVSLAIGCFFAPGLQVAAQKVAPPAGEGEAADLDLAEPPPPPLDVPGDDLDVVPAEATPAPAPAPSPTQTPTPTPLSFEEQFLKDVEDAYNTVLGVIGTFDQTHNSGIFLEETKSSAEFYVRKPDFFRMTYSPPDSSQHYYYKGSYYLYVPEHEQVTKYAFDPGAHSVESLNVMLLGFDLDAREIFNVYHVRLTDQQTSTEDVSTTTGLRFTPLHPEQTNLDFLEIVFVEEAGPNAASADFPMPRRVYYVNKDTGDTTEIRIQDIRLFKSQAALEAEPRLSEKSFDPFTHIPPDVEVVEQN